MWSRSAWERNTLRIFLAFCNKPADTPSPQSNRIPHSWTKYQVANIAVENPVMVSFGVMGGATQPQAHAQIMMNIIDFGMNLQEAGDAPRILHSGSSEPTGERMTDGGIVQLESAFEYESIRELMKRGHKVQFDVGAYGGYQAILYDQEKDVYFGASESRKDGQAAGY